MLGAITLTFGIVTKKSIFIQETKIAFILLVPNIEVLSSWFKKENTKDLIIELF